MKVENIYIAFKISYDTTWQKFFFFLGFFLRVCVELDYSLYQNAREELDEMDYSFIMVDCPIFILFFLVI